MQSTISPVVCAATIYHLTLTKMTFTDNTKAINPFKQAAAMYSMYFRRIPELCNSSLCCQSLMYLESRNTKQVVLQWLHTRKVETVTASQTDWLHLCLNTSTEGLLLVMVADEGMGSGTGHCIDRSRVVHKERTYHAYQDEGKGRISGAAGNPGLFGISIHSRMHKR